MKRASVWAVGLGLVALAAGGCSRAEKNAAPPSPQAAIAQRLAPADWPAVAVVATNSVELQDRLQIAGDVVVTQASAGPTLGWGAKLVVGLDATLDGSATADTLALGDRAVVTGDAKYNQRAGNGTVRGTSTSPLALRVPVSVPTLPSISPGTQAVSLTNSEQRTLAAGALHRGRLPAPTAISATATRPATAPALRSGTAPELTAAIPAPRSCDPGYRRRPHARRTGTSCADEVATATRPATVRGSCVARQRAGARRWQSVHGGQLRPRHRRRHDLLAAGTSCADADLCNGDETCDGTGACVAGIAARARRRQPLHRRLLRPSHGVTQRPLAAGTAAPTCDLCNGDERCSARDSARRPAGRRRRQPCTVTRATRFRRSKHPRGAGTSCADADLCNGTSPASACDLSVGHAADRRRREPLYG